TVIVVAPAAKPPGMVNCRLFTWPAPLLLVTDPVTVVPPSVTVTDELAAKPAPYTETVFPGLAWFGVNEVILGLIVTEFPLVVIALSVADTGYVPWGIPCPTLTPCEILPLASALT